jgi:hypothetical protein
MLNRLSRTAALAALALIAGSEARAQSGSSALAGVVRDSSGSPLAGAGVRVVNEETNVVSETTSNQEGIYA